jgi:hypothetical protein
MGGLGTFNGHLVRIFFPFVYFYKEKSGNPPDQKNLATLQTRMALIWIDTFS